MILWMNTKNKFFNYKYNKYLLIYYMEVIIILSAVNIVASLVSPIILATAYFINRIKTSDCCNSHLELSSPTNEKLS